MTWSKQSNSLLYSINSCSVLLASVHVPGAGLIAISYGTTLETVQLSVAAYLAVYAASQILVVLVTGIPRPESVILLGCVIAGIGTFVCSVSAGIEVFYTGRVLQAVGASLCVLSLRVFIRLRLAPRVASSFLASLFVVTSTALLLGPIAAGYMMENIGWRSIFLVCVVWAGSNAAIFGFFLRKLDVIAPGKQQDRSGQTNVRNFVECLLNPRVLLFVCYNTAIYWFFYGFVTGIPIVAKALDISDAEILGMIAATSGIGSICGGLVATYLARIWSPDRIIGTGLGSAFMPAILFVLPISSGAIETAFALAFVGFISGWVIGLVQPNALISAMSVSGTEPASAAALIGCMQILGGAVASFAMPLAGRSLDTFLIVLAMASWMAFAAWVIARQRETVE